MINYFYSPSVSASAPSTEQFHLHMRSLEFETCDGLVVIPFSFSNLLSGHVTHQAQAFCSPRLQDD